ncbi:hypothetical protein V8E54_013302 [Elaphomyces granulatus]
MNGPDTAPLVVMSASGQGDTPLLGTVVESIVCLNTELEVAIRYPQPRRLTATAIAERQRTSVSDLDLGKECHPPSNTFRLRECWLVKREEEKQQATIDDFFRRPPMLIL